METPSLFHRPECQICFHTFSFRRRPKLLGCGHTCCQVCLNQIVLDRQEISCPWCRQVTNLSGLSVVQLPDDPKALAATPVYIRLPDSSRYLLPLRRDEVIYEYRYKRQTEEAVEDDEDEHEEREVEIKSSARTGFCTILLLAVILIFLLAIVLHNMSCVSKRFSVISCG